MPKAKILALFSAAIIVAGMLSGCGSDTPLEPYESPLTGTWSESYSLMCTDIIIEWHEDIVPRLKMSSVSSVNNADEGSDISWVRYTSVISFDNFNFELAIYDTLGTLHKEVKGDVDYKGDKVILTAKYSWFRYHEVWNIEYDPYVEYSETFNIYGLDSDTLVLGMVFYDDEEAGIEYVPPGSFLWSVPGTWGMMKYSARYSREE